jgi:hypothetical protein
MNHERGDVRARRHLSFALMVAAVVSLSGCGTAADRDRVRAVTARFFAALDARHGQDACAQLSAALRTTLMEDQPGRSCARAALELRSRGAAITAVQVYATSARADLADGQSIFLGQTREGWRIQALGCRPRASGPYECEDEA